MPEKTCCKCGESKNLSGFYKNKSTKDGLTPDCKDCVKARINKYRNDNPDTVKKRKKEYYENNKEKVIASQREYRRKNGRYREYYLRYLERVGVDQYREECRERAKTYRERNREEIARKARERRAKNVEAAVQSNREYRARLGERYLARRRELYAEKPEVYRRGRRERTKIEKAQTPSWADIDEIKRIYKKAEELRKKFGKNSFCVDHIVPLRSKYVCGLHCPDNLRVITWEENCAKSNNWWPDMPEPECSQ